MNGYLDLESQIGKGSTFRFFVQVNDVEDLTENTPVILNKRKVAILGGTNFQGNAICEYIHEYKEKEGIELEYDKIKKKIPVCAA